MDCIYKNKSNIQFEARVKLCDKRFLCVPHKTNLLEGVSPLDFFYSENKFQRNADLLSRHIKNKIREAKENGNGLIFESLLSKTGNRFANAIAVAANRLTLLAKFKSFNKSCRILSRTEQTSPEYIEQWAIIGNSLKHKFVNINIEDRLIEKIALSEKPAIFILNHDNPYRDKFIYPIFNSFLNYAYAAFGKQNNCPRPYIIVSENVLKRAGEKFRQFYKRMGLIPVDASMSSRNFQQNIKPVRDLINKFINNRANIFIFPEGNNSIYKTKTIEEKFQPGIAKIINKILEKKSSVNVFSLGISYDGYKNNMGFIHIGKPVSLSRIGNHIYFTKEGRIPEKIGENNNKKTIANITKILCQDLKENVMLSKSQI